jgi:hypothetical protein
MRTGLLLTLSLCLLGLNCSSAATRTPGGNGGSGGDDTGGTGGGSSGGSGGSKTGGAGGSSGKGGAGGGGAGRGGASGGSGGSVGSAGGCGGASGGAGGTTSADGGADAGPVSSAGCAGSIAKVCDDFDQQTMGQEPKGMYSIVKAGNGTLTIDNSKFFSGTQSLHIHLTNPGADSKAQLAFTAPVLPFASNDVHARAMVWLTKNPGNHWDFATAFGTDPPADDDTKIQYTLGSMSGHLMAVYQPGDDSVDSSTQFPVGRWGCLQWEFKGAMDGTHLIRIQLDGKVIDKGEITKGGIAKGNWPATTWKSMKVGWINFGGVNQPVDMWIDDLAVSDQEIPCPPAK